MIEIFRDELDRGRESQGCTTTCGSMSEHDGPEEKVDVLVPVCSPLLINYRGANFFLPFGGAIGLCGDSIKIEFSDGDLPHFIEVQATNAQSG